MNQAVGVVRLAVDNDVHLPGVPYAPQAAVKAVILLKYVPCFAIERLNSP